MVAYRLVDCLDDGTIGGAAPIVAEDLIGVQSRLRGDPLDLAICGGDASHVCSMALRVHGVCVLVGEVVASDHLTIGKPPAPQVRMRIVDACVDDSDRCAGAIQPRSCARRPGPERLVDAHGRICVVVEQLLRVRFEHAGHAPCTRDRLQVAARDGEGEAVEGNREAPLQRVRDVLPVEARKQRVLLIQNGALAHLRSLCLQPSVAARTGHLDDERGSFHAENDVAWRGRRAHASQEFRVDAGGSCPALSCLCWQ